MRNFLSNKPVLLRLMVLLEDSKLHLDVLLASWRLLSVVLFVDVILILGDIMNHLHVYQWIIDCTIGSRFLPHNKCFLLRWLALFSVTGIYCVDQLVVSINDEGILQAIWASHLNNFLWTLSNKLLLAECKWLMEDQRQQILVS